jgi:hypothetical protein
VFATVGGPIAIVKAVTVANPFKGVEVKLSPFKVRVLADDPTKVPPFIVTQPIFPVMFSIGFPAFIVASNVAALGMTPGTQLPAVFQLRLDPPHVAAVPVQAAKALELSKKKMAMSDKNFIAASAA